MVLPAHSLSHVRVQTTIPKTPLRQHSSAGSSGWCRQESPSVVVGFHRAAGVWQTAWRKDTFSARHTTRSTTARACAVPALESTRSPRPLCAGTCSWLYYNQSWDLLPQREIEHLADPSTGICGRGPVFKPHIVYFMFGFDKIPSSFQSYYCLFYPKNTGLEVMQETGV